MSTINVIIADDHPVVRAGLRAVLEFASDITVLADVDTPDELIAGVRDAARGRTLLSQRIAGRLMGRLRQPAVELTARELEVLHLVASGQSNRRIAAELVLTEATVKTHLVHIFTKLDVTSRTEAVAVSRERGILGT